MIGVRLGALCVALSTASASPSAFPHDYYYSTHIFGVGYILQDVECVIGVTLLHAIIIIQLARVAALANQYCWPCHSTVPTDPCIIYCIFSGQIQSLPRGFALVCILNFCCCQWFIVHDGCVRAVEVCYRLFPVNKPAG